MNNLKVLYEDNHVIVVVKPFNVLSQADATHDKDLLTMVKEYVKEKYNKPGNVYIGLVHRLDRPVGGVMVFTRSSKAASRLTEMFKEHNFSKKYLAVVNGKMENNEGELTDYLLKLDNGNTVVDKKGKLSKLKYKVLEYNKDNNLSLVDIELLTGRHHQIRVQFATRNHALYGDQRYGTMNNKQIALWAYELKFVHPVKKEEQKFICLPEKKEIWKLFDINL